MNAPFDLTQLHTAAAALLLEPGERTRCEMWTRVMGYHRPVASFNLGRQSEFCERRFFVE